MRGVDRTGFGTVAVVVGLIVSAFVLATITPMVRIERIRIHARGITANAVPSIEELVGARRAISRIRIEFERAERDVENSAAWIELQDALDRLRHHVERYLALPSFPGEREAWADVRESLDGIDAMMHAIASSEATADLTAIRPLLAAALERADAVLLATIEVNADQIRAFARLIDNARSRSRRDALVLNGVSLVLAGALLLWSARTLRQRRAAERTVRHLLEQRAAELDVFATRVAHDLVSPLTPAALWLERLQESSDEQTRHAAERGLRAVHRTLSTVEGLLAFARAGKVEVVGARTEVEAVAREVIASVDAARAAAGASLELVAEGGPRWVAVHDGVLGTVLANLIGNALKYLGDAPVRRVTVHVADRGDRIRIEVRDTGPGIPSELHERVFDAYFRASEKTTGLGLGLATVKRLVEAHEGRVGVTSSADGSIFWVELPAAPGVHGIELAEARTTG